MSGFKGLLSFDATSADTLAASDLVGSVIRASGASVTSTLISGKQALDVNVANALAIDVDLDHANDSVKIGDGTDFLSVNADGSINITDNGGSLTVDAVDLDIRDLAFASDSVTAHQGGTWSVTATATQLDIDDLNATDDAVAAWMKDGSGNAISSVGGSLLVADISTGAVENTAKSVTSTSAALLSSQLANRKELWLQNRGSVNGFVGKSGVTTANGFEIQKGVSVQFRIGAAVSLHAVTDSGTADFRMMEFAA